MGKRFRCALDTALLDQSLGIKQVLEAAVSVVPQELLEIKPGSGLIVAPEAVRH
jgi:hypothetical protein